MKMSPELRELRRRFPLPISRLAYTRLYEKAKEVMGQLAAVNVPGLEDLDLLFLMLYKASKDIDPTYLATSCPVLMGVYQCLLADLEAARIRSERARMHARRRAEGQIAPKRPKKPTKRQLDEERERELVAGIKNYVAHLPRFYL